MQSSGQRATEQAAQRARGCSSPRLRAASTVERYAIYDEFASGGMATVHLARLDGAHGFRRTVAIKRLRRHLTLDRDFALMLVDEARIASRVRHNNVVSMVDVVRTEDELLLVMDYVHGESLLKLVRRCLQTGQEVPLAVACAIVADALHGLHAAHEAKGRRGQPLEIVHRDVSPQNILVGADGVTRIADFGIAKAAGRAQVTRDNVIKGKLSYMAPEQVEGARVSRASDVFAASIVLWELTAGEPLFAETSHEQMLYKVLSAPIAAPSTRRAQLPAALDAIVMRGLERKPERRFASASEMALALESALPIARPAQVARWVERVAGGVLAERAKLLSQIERADDLDTIPPYSVAEHASGVRVLPEREPEPRLEATQPESTATRMIARPRMPARRPAGRHLWVGAALLFLIAAAALASWLMRTEVPVRRRAPVPPLPVVQPVPVEVEVAPLQPPSKPARRKGKAPRRTMRTLAAHPCDPPYTVDAAGDKLFKADCI